MTRAQANRLMELCEKAKREGALYGRDREEQERLGEILKDSGIVDPVQHFALPGVTVE